MMTMTSVALESRMPQDAGRKLMLGALAVGVIGLLISAALAFGVSPARFFRSYLISFMLVLSIALGGLIFILMQHASRAGWSVAVRRITELMAGNLRWLWLLFVPVALAMYFSDRTHLYEWNVPGVTDHDEVLAGKEGYLDATFWLVRAVIFFGIWALLAGFYLRTSVAQDTTGDVNLTHRMQRLAPVGILLFAITITLAAFDWMMSLEPHWFSTIWGVYFFAATCAASFATLILLMYGLQRLGWLGEEVNDEHYQDMGKLLFAFGVVFWAYIGYSQFMLIWYANLPEETTWFLIRSQGGWWGVSMLLLLGHFLIPFLAIMSRHPKRRRHVLALGAAWMLLMAFVDFYWLIMPQVPMDLLSQMQQNPELTTRDFVQTFQTGLVPAAQLDQLGLGGQTQLTYAQVYGFRPHLLDLTLLLGMLGLLAAGTLFQMRRCSLVAAGDPRLGESLAFENI
jgi:hypothetical protein